MRKLNSHQGIGLLELMLSILVITAIILGATKYYLVAREELRITQAQDLINNVANAGYKWVEGQSSFIKIVDVHTLVDAKLLPAKYGSDNISPWGGSIIIQVKSIDSSDWLLVSLANITSTASKLLAVKYGECGDYTNVTACAITNPFQVLFRSP